VFRSPPDGGRYKTPPEAARSLGRQSVFERVREPSSFADWFAADEAKRDGKTTTADKARARSAPCPYGAASDPSVHLPP